MTDVIVIGAGVAGLTAASVLSQAGLAVDIVEARDRIGGRIFTDHSSTSAELGAEFVHGKPEVTFNLARAGNIKLTEMRGNLWQSVNGKLSRASSWDSGESAIWQALEEWNGADQTFDDFVKEHFPGDQWADARRSAAGFIEGYEAARTDRVSLKWFLHTESAQDAIGGDRSFRAEGGYDTIPRQIAAKFVPGRVSLHLSTIVDEIHWKRGAVEVIARAAGKSEALTFTTPRAVVTLPLGVIKNHFRFSPALDGKQSALDHIEMGSVIKPILRFRERFWDDRMSFLFSDDPTVPTWWTQYPADALLLTGWVGGPRAEMLSHQSKDAVIAQTLNSLARIFNVPRERLDSLLEATYLHDWQADPFSLGAYSYVVVGGMDAPEKLAQPAEDTLFFAGEATDMLGYTGTVHGAIVTGQRAAEEVLRSIG